MSRESVDTVDLFAQLPLGIEDDSLRNLKHQLENSAIDFDREVKERLMKVILEIVDSKIEPIVDNYTVSVRFKDSVYAYAPRCFAHAELREITDDLLNRGVIQPSVSPYCARVSVRRKNGKMRLCVDLRFHYSKLSSNETEIPFSVD